MLDMRLAWLLSSFAHISAPFLWLGLSFLLAFLFGISFHFPSPQKETQDLTFVLLPDGHREQPPIDPDTAIRARHDSQAGGKHDPARPITQPDLLNSPSITNTTRPENSPEKKATQPAFIERSPKVQQLSSPDGETKQSQQQAKHLTRTPPEPLPIPTPPIAKPIAETTPTPQTFVKPMATLASQATQAEQHSTSESNRLSRIAPSLQSPPSQGHPVRTGTGANPSPGNPNGPLGVDAKGEANFGPYMQGLQKRIKQNWHPPRGNKSKRIVVIFRTDRTGHLHEVQVSESSGDIAADNAAILAVRKAFPYEPLPASFQGNVVDIEFTFDYNVLGAKNRFLPP